MNKLLPSAVLLLTTCGVYAETMETQSFILNTPLQIASADSAPSTNTSTTTPPISTDQAAPTAPVTPSGEQNANTTTPSTNETANPIAPANTAKVDANAIIDCNYKIPAETKSIDDALILKWAEKATQQSFNYDFAKVDDQLSALKACYTDEGWTGFNDALQKSGNLDTIKKDKLTVSSMVDGPLTISPIKENQWKLNIPLQVVYQNDKEKLTQPLTVDLIVGRTIKGDLGIMQMIASPREDKSKNPTK